MVGGEPSVLDGAVQVTAAGRPPSRPYWSSPSTVSTKPTAPSAANIPAGIGFYVLRKLGKNRASSAAETTAPRMRPARPFSVPRR